MNKRKRTILGLAAVALVLPSAASPVPPVAPPVAMPVQYDILATLDSPDDVAAGSTWKVMIEARLNSTGATIIQVNPIDDETDGCGIGSVEVQSGTDLGNNQFLIYNVPGTFSPADEELQFRVAPPYVRLGLGYNSVEAAGICNVKVNVLQPLNPWAAIYELSKTVTLQLPSVPILMGTIATRGGVDEEDRAEVTTPALPLMAYAVVSEHAFLELQGTATHSDGMDYGDYGRFWFGGGTVSTDGMSVAEDTIGQLFSKVTAVPYEKGKTVETTYCFYGQYVDGGMYDTWEEPKAETCASVSATAPGEWGEVASDVCDLFRRAEVQAQFAAGAPIAYLIPVSGRFAGSVVNIDRAQWQGICSESPHGTDTPPILGEVPLLL